MRTIFNMLFAILLVPCSHAYALAPQKRDDGATVQAPAPAVQGDPLKLSLKDLCDLVNNPEDREATKPGTLAYYDCACGFLSQGIPEEVSEAICWLEGQAAATEIINVKN